MSFAARPDPDRTALTLVAELVPHATVVILAGSVPAGLATATSDLDVLVLDPTETYRRTLAYRGWTVELFVQTPASHRRFVRAEVAARRSPLLHMTAQGRLLLDRDGSGPALQRTAADQLLAGPPALTPAERDQRRYLLTDLLTDLADSADPDEQLMLAARAFTELAELLLVADRRWSGAGKWLHRRLATARPERARDLAAGLRRLAATADPAVFLTAADTALDLVGGRLTVGYQVGRGVELD